jgi:hypothetical protein
VQTGLKADLLNFASLTTLKRAIGFVIKIDTSTAKSVTDVFYFSWFLKTYQIRSE